MKVKDMACHTWALNGSEDVGVAEQVNLDFERLMTTIGRNYDFGGDLHGRDLAIIRQETMTDLLAIAAVRTDLIDHEVYLCGGFREGQVAPEHMWLEDRTSNRTYDTFINQPIVVINEVGKSGESFRPGCEADAFETNEICRVRIDGFTRGQFLSLPR